MERNAPEFGAGPEIQCVSCVNVENVQWLLREVREGRLDLLLLEVGRWWEANPVERCEEEVDVVLSGADGELILRDCKWNNRPVDANVLGVLKRRAELLPGGNHARLFLF